MKKLTYWMLISAALLALAGCVDSENPNAQLDAEIRQIDQYLANLGLTDDVLYDNSTGIRFIVHNVGNDAPPRTGQTVTINQLGKLLSDGTTFSDGQIVKKLEEISPEGLRYCLGALLEGSGATFYIPSKYAFGEAGTSGVPANSPVVYEVLLANVEKTEAQKTQFTADTAAIKEYLEFNNIDNAFEHSSGIWYTIDVQGNGESPTPYQTAGFTYDLRLLTAPTTSVQTGTIPPNSSIFGLIDGMKIGLPLIEVGTTATFYIPSGLAYGTTGSQGIPANANLIFTVSLNSIGQ